MPFFELDSSILCNAYYISQILGLGFIICYVIYTKLSFDQMKKQANEIHDQTKLIQKQIDFSQDAFLRATIKTEKNVSDEKFLKSWMTREIHTMLVSNITAHYNNPMLVSETEFLTLVLKNHGNTDIVKTEINYDYQVDIHTLEFEIPNYTDSISYQKKIVIDDLIEKNSDIVVVLFPISAYPDVNGKLSIDYIDVRGKDYHMKDPLHIKYSRSNFADVNEMMMKTKETSQDKANTIKEL